MFPDRKVRKCVISVITRHARTIASCIPHGVGVFTVHVAQPRKSRTLEMHSACYYQWRAVVIQVVELGAPYYYYYYYYRKYVNVPTHKNYVLNNKKIKK
jgi:hypothetical protein